MAWPVNDGVSKRRKAYVMLRTHYGDNVMCMTDESVVSSERRGQPMPMFFRATAKSIPANLSPDQQSTLMRVARQ